MSDDLPQAHENMQRVASSTVKHYSPAESSSVQEAQEASAKRVRALTRLGLTIGNPFSSEYSYSSSSPASLNFHLNFHLNFPLNFPPLSANMNPPLLSSYLFHPSQGKLNPKFHMEKETKQLHGSNGHGGELHGHFPVGDSNK